MPDIKHYRGKNSPLESTPFITIVTRAYKKPNCLDYCIKSIQNQTDPDYEHVLIRDTIGLGLAWADQVLNEKKDLNHGKFVMVLDDDDEITHQGFISLLKFIDDQYRPDLIIWRGYFPMVEYALPPIDSRFGSFPARGLIGSFNYCVKRDLYNKHIHLCSSGISGDFDFLKAVFDELPKERVRWIKKILVRQQQKSFGKSIDRKD